MAWDELLVDDAVASLTPAAEGWATRMTPEEEDVAQRHSELVRFEALLTDAEAGRVKMAVRVAAGDAELGHQADDGPEGAGLKVIADWYLSRASA
jgi:hypothetical protein